MLARWGRRDRWVGGRDETRAQAVLRFEKQLKDIPMVTRRGGGSCVTIVKDVPQIQVPTGITCTWSGAGLLL